MCKIVHESIHQIDLCNVCQLLKKSIRSITVVHVYKVVSEVNFNDIWNNYIIRILYMFITVIYFSVINIIENTLFT